MTPLSIAEYIIAALESASLLPDALRAIPLARERLDIPRAAAHLAAPQAETQGDAAPLAAAQADTPKRPARVDAQAEPIYDETMEVYYLEMRLYSKLEMRLYSKIHAILGLRTKLRGTRVLCPLFHPAGAVSEFVDTILDAEDDGVITEDQRVRILSANLIAVARRPYSRQPVYVSFKVACSLDEGDVRRVEETGDALARVFPEAEVMGFVYGYSISERGRARAEANGVEVVLYRPKRRY